MFANALSNRGIFHRPHLKISFVYLSFPSSLHTYAELIKICTRDQALKQGKNLHAQLIVNGLASSNHFASELIVFYAKAKQLSSARKVFDKIPKPNFYQWTVLIGACSRHGSYQDVLNVFSAMQNERLRPNKFVIPSVLRACGHVFDLQTGKVLHSVILRHSFESDVVINTALIDMYSRCRHVEKARKVYDGMKEKDLVTLNTMVLGYAQNGFAKEGFLLVEQMQILNIKPDLVTWNTLISGFAQAGDKLMVKKLFGLMSIYGFDPDVISWTSVISGFVQNFHNKLAFDAFKQMLEHGVYPNSATISSLLPACATLANVRLGSKLHGYALVIGVEEDIYVRSALIDMYSKCGLLPEAKMLFSKMPERATVTWNSMIFGYANHSYCDEAVELFNQMEKMEGEKINHLSFTAVLTACSHGRLVELGQSLFLLMHEKYKIVPRLEHYACMIELLGRAGKLSEAYDMIKTIPVEPDLFVWGALLGACRQHGEIDLAEIAARHLAELEPENAGNNKILSNIYADAGSWENVAKLKMVKNKRLRRQFTGCSWIEAA